ncbi:MAG TPA: hypothetical protein VGR85_11455 [Candidatus Limnocylindria bacterium]|nr:hypothetical protein [Candidatus Limnocylindria bacterium]
MFAALVQLETVAVSIGAVLLTIAGALATVGNDLWWLRVLGLASFTAGLPAVLSKPPDSPRKLDAEVFPRLWTSPGAGIVMLGTCFAFMTSFTGLLRLALEPRCVPSIGRVVCAPSVLFDTTSDALFALMLTGAALALVAIGFGASRAPDGSWGYALIGGGLLVPLSFLSGTWLPFGVGVMLLGVAWAAVAYVVWHHKAAIT